MPCQACGVEAVTRKVAFYENVGVVFVRFRRSVQGKLCKSCIHRQFWRTTGKTFFLGWWGTVSLIVTPFILLNNVGRYLFCLTMSLVPPGAAAPRFGEEEIRKIMPYGPDLFARIEAGEDLESAAVAVAQKAGTSPAQVFLFLQAAAQAAMKEQGS